MRILDSGATSYYLPHHRTLSDSAHANNGAATGDYHADIHARPSKRYNVLRRLKIIDYLCYNQISKCLVAARQRDPSSRSGFTNGQSPLDSATHQIGLGSNINPSLFSGGFFTQKLHGQRLRGCLPRRPEQEGTPSCNTHRTLAAGQRGTCPFPLHESVWGWSRVKGKPLRGRRWRPLTAS